MTRRQSVWPALLLALGLAVAACSNRATRGDGDAPAVAPDGPALDRADVEGRPVAQVEELLVGRFPGVRVVQLPGGGIAVRVWPPGTFMGEKDPLYVVDGMQVQVTPGRGLDWLSPGDIATIEVLKDISETAAYGVRGGNGVVVITTRRGGG
jgi:TonB-dependent SusC/RagA subfamily outer membrane receptor